MLRVGGPYPAQDYDARGDFDAVRPELGTLWPWQSRTASVAIG